MTDEPRFCILRHPVDKADTSWCGRSTRGERFRFVGMDAVIESEWSGSPLKPCRACVEEATAGFARAVASIETRR